MISTIYHTIFLEFIFSDDLTDFNIITHYKVKGVYYKGQLISKKQAQDLYPDSLEVTDIITKYYPELKI